MISVWKKTIFGGCPEARIKYKTQSLFTVLACPRKYSQALLLRCTRLPAVGQLPSSCPAHQSCPWICPLCGTAPGRPRAYAVCRTACMSAQTTAGQQKRKSDINANIPKWDKFQHFFKTVTLCFVSLPWCYGKEKWSLLHDWNFCVTLISPCLNLGPKFMRKQSTAI